MRRRNLPPKAAETLKKKTDGFTKNPDASTSRDLKRKRSVTFVDVDHHHRNHSQTGPSIDAKTSEFAFFNKLKSSFGLSSEAGGQTHNDAGKDRKAKDICNTTCSSPVYLTPKDKEKDPGKCSSGFDNLRCAGSSDEKEHFFSVKRKRLNQWVKHTWFPEIIPKLTSNGGDLVSLLLTRMFPGTEERHERSDRVQRRTFLDSPGSKFFKRSHENYAEADHSLQTEKNRSISCRPWLENSSVPSLQFATSHVHSSFIPRSPQDFSFNISYPKEWVYNRPSLLSQKASLSFPVEETLDSSLPFGNYKSLSLGYQGEEIGYSSEALPHDHMKPSSALLLEWNTENTSTRNTDDLPLSYHTKLITYPNASSSSSSSLADNPWSSDYSSSHDVVTRELYPLPLLSDYTPGRFLLPTTNQTSHFEHEFERHMIDDEDVVAANQKLQTFHHANSSSDCLTRGHTYYHSPSSYAVDHSPFKVPGCEIVSFPFSSISNSNLLEASSPTQSDQWWI